MRRIIIAAALAIAALLIPVSQLAAAGASGRPPLATARSPASCWSTGPGRTAPAGTRSPAGSSATDTPSMCRPNPLLGLTYDAAFIRDFLHTISGPIILVGHSYGGAVITNAATGDSQVKALVYVDAFAPAQGQTIGQLVSAHPGSCVLPAANVTAQPYPGAPAGAAAVYIKQSVFGSCMANGLPAAQARVLAATQRPLTSLALTQKSGPGLEDHPVVGRDRHRRPRDSAGRAARPWPARRTPISPWRPVRRTCP